MNMLIYFGEAIDQAANNNVTTAKHAIIEKLLQLGHFIYRPKGAFLMDPTWTFNRETSGAMEAAHKLRTINMQALRTSDIALFYWDGSPSWGLPIELDWCADQYKPFIFVDHSRQKVLPAYMMQALARVKAHRVHSKEWDVDRGHEYADPLLNLPRIIATALAQRKDDSLEFWYTGGRRETQRDTGKSL